MTPNIIQNGFLLAGLANFLTIPVVSKLFTNDILMSAQPAVMGAFGLVCIMLWGLAYIAVRQSYNAVPWLIAVFALEKLVYVIAWLHWHLNNSLTSLFEQDIFAGVFYAIYGVNDFIFMLFFAIVFLKVKTTDGKID